DPLMAAANFPEGTDPALIERRRRAYESVGGETLLADLTACDRFDVLDRLWEIRCRTQALVGAADVLTSPKYMRMLADRVSAARYIEYPNAGHMLPLERPAEVAGELAVLWAASLDGRVSRMRGSSSLRSDSRSAASPPAG
ncbi:MAG: alpha/beta hydrolase, partial [Actinomycetota bacterium]